MWSILVEHRGMQYTCCHPSKEFIAKWLCDIAEYASKNGGMEGLIIKTFAYWGK
jgi:hypothetical protein